MITPTQQIPEEIKKIALSVEIYDSAEKIGGIFGLHIDQIGALDAEIRSILLGQNSSSTFIDHLVKNLEIDKKLAVQIVQEVNKEIFVTIKSNLQSKNNLDEPTKAVIANIENAGNFSVEKGNTEGASSPDLDQITYADRAKILDGVENPPARQGAGSSNFPSSADIQAGTVKDNHTEPLVDYLLANPTGQTKKDVVVQVPKIIEPTKRLGPDPYREEAK